MKKTTHTKGPEARTVDSIQPTTNDAQANQSVETDGTEPKHKPVKEYGGRKNGLDPTRFGDWEKNGRCIDF